MIHWLLMDSVLWPLTFMITIIHLNRRDHRELAVARLRDTDLDGRG